MTCVGGKKDCTFSAKIRQRTRIWITLCGRINKAESNGGVGADEKSNKGNNVELPGWGPEDWVEPGSCLMKVCGLEGHMCADLDCVKTLAKQHKHLTILFGNVVMKAKTETELIADWHGGTEVNLATALGVYSMFGSLESLLKPAKKHEVVTAISVEVFPGVLQTEKKYIGKWKEAIEAKMKIRQIEAYRRPLRAR